MNAAAATPARDSVLPFPQFKGFVTVFHVIFISGVLFCLFLRWCRPGFAWSGNDNWLLGLIISQIVLYVGFLIVQWQPPEATGYWLGYFLVSFIIWYAEWQVEDSLQWTAWAYVGQLFGVMRPRFSVPTTLLVFAIYFGKKFGFEGIVTLGPWEWIVGLVIVATAIAQGLFLYHLVRTSTERAKLIQELESARKQLERAREHDAELAALQERERLARDLHDSLGHGLVTLTVQLEAAQRLYQVDPVRASALMDEMKGLTRSGMEQLRRSLANLRTPGLGDRSLFTALKDLSAKGGEASPAVSCLVPENSDCLPAQVAEVLWRVAQEGLSNVRQHARATTAWIEVALRPQEVVLTVSDDGIGLLADQAHKAGHYGLRGLHERVEGVGGIFTVSHHNPHGTQLEARVPLTTT